MDYIWRIPVHYLSLPKKIGSKAFRQATWWRIDTVVDAFFCLKNGIVVDLVGGFGEACAGAERQRRDWVAKELELGDALLLIGIAAPTPTNRWRQWLTGCNCFHNARGCDSHVGFAESCWSHSVEVSSTCPEAPDANLTGSLQSSAPHNLACTLECGQCNLWLAETAVTVHKEEEVAIRQTGGRRYQQMWQNASLAWCLFFDAILQNF